MLPEVFKTGEDHMDEFIVSRLLYLEQFEIIRFLGASGVSGAVFAGIFFPLQRWSGVHYRRCLYIAFVPSLIAGFTLHKYWTFADLNTQLVWLQMALYTFKRIVFIRVNDYLLRRSVERHGVRVWLAQILIALSGFGLNYLLTKLIFSL